MRLSWPHIATVHINSRMLHSFQSKPKQALARNHKTLKTPKTLTAIQVESLEKRVLVSMCRCQLYHQRLQRPAHQGY